MDPLSTAAAAGAAKGFGAALGKLVIQHAARALDKSPGHIEKIKTNITPHIEATYQKCSQIKTLLNPLRPATLLAIHAIQRFDDDGVELDHYDLVERIKRQRANIIITGSGGSGKSMFMRYLWLSLFENSDGRIPLFIELRGLNALSTLSLTQYLFQSMSLGKASISAGDFNKGIESGDFIILLDGFDEIAKERRDVVQQEIISLAENYPLIKIVVSGRADENDRFASWPTFSVIQVAPMKRMDVIDLVQKAEFDGEHKERFIKKLKDDRFYRRYTSFLSNPLLTSMMLLTFSYSLDIPDRMHSFYGHAFDALYQRHDNYKPGGYKRQFNTSLSEDEFKRLFSYFCLLTYHAERFEFEREGLLDYIRKAARAASLEVDSAAFLTDLAECVCLIVREGITYSFSHRSFQEYFAAYCLAYVTSTARYAEVIEHLSGRIQDQVVMMLADMDPDKFRDRYLIPVAERYEVAIQSRSRRRSVAVFAQHFAGNFTIRRWHRDEMMIVFNEPTGFSDFVSVIQKIGRRNRPASRAGRGRAISDAETLQRMVAVTGRDNVSSIHIDILEEEFRFRFEARDEAENEAEFIPPQEEQVTLNAIFEASELHRYLSILLRDVNAYIVEARRESRRSSAVLDADLGF